MDYKKVASQLLITFHKKLVEANIEHWLQNGTSLGIYRQGDFIGDNWKDIDIGFFHKDIESVRQIALEVGLVLFHEWRKELCFAYSDKGIKIKFDCFFHDTDEENIYWYAYKKNNTDNIWNIEWRKTFSKEDFFPLTKVKFLNNDFNLPGNIEKYLTTIYGNWKVPAPWKYENYEKVQDQDYNVKTELKSFDIRKNHTFSNIAVVLTTFLRDNMVLKTLEYYDRYPYRIYLADQGMFSIEKEKAYEKFRQRGHVIIYCPFDSGLSYCRNKIISLVKEPYLFLTDDDILIREKLDRHLKLFSNEKIGIVGGQLHNHTTNLKQVYSNTLEFVNGELHYKKKNDGFCDIVLNFFIARTKLFKDIRYDNNLKLTEHSDFFLTLKQNTNWKVYYEPSLVGDHYPERPEEYKIMRARSRFLEMFKEKWGITELKGN